MVPRLRHVHLLVFDDPGLVPLADMDRINLLEVIEGRHGSGSTIVTGQLAIGHWHEAIGEPDGIGRALRRGMAGTTLALFARGVTAIKGGQEAGRTPFIPFRASSLWLSWPMPNEL